MINRYAKKDSVQPAPKAPWTKETEYLCALGVAASVMSSRQIERWQKLWARQRALILAGKIDIDDCIRRVEAEKAARGEVDHGNGAAPPPA